MRVRLCVCARMYVWSTKLWWCRARFCTAPTRIQGGVRGGGRESARVQREDAGKSKQTRESERGNIPLAEAELSSKRGSIQVDGQQVVVRSFVFKVRHRSFEHGSDRCV